VKSAKRGPFAALQAATGFRAGHALTSRVFDGSYRTKEPTMLWGRVATRPHGDRNEAQSRERSTSFRCARIARDQRHVTYPRMLDRRSSDRDRLCAAEPLRPKAAAPLKKSRSEPKDKVVQHAAAGVADRIFESSESRLPSVPDQRRIRS
jgi:hypothetical protein